MQEEMKHATPLPHTPEGNKYKLPAIIILGIVLLFSAFALFFYLSKNPAYRNMLQMGKNPDTFEITNSSPEKFDPNFSVVGEPTFVFSQKLNLSEKDLNKYFTLSPSVSGSWHLTNDNHVVYFSTDKKQKDSLVQTFPHDSIYSIKVSKDIQSTEGKRLAEDKSFMFRTNKDPRFVVSVDKKLINAYPNKIIPVEFSVGSDTDAKPTSLKVHIRASTLDELTTYFASPDQYTFLYQAAKSVNQQEIATLDAPVKIVAPYGSSIELPEMKTGLYYVTLSDDHGSEDLFVNVSNHVNQAYLSADSMQVWVTDINGKSLAGIDSEIYNLTDTVKKLASNKTDNNGLVRFTEKKPELLVTKKGNELGLTYINNRRFYSLSKYKVFSFTDRPVYRPGDTVHFKAVVRSRIDGNYQPVTEEPLYFKFMPNGYSDSKNDYKKISPDENGTITEDINLPNALQEIHPIIVVATKDNDEYTTINTLDLKVESYRKPDFDINVNTSDIEYISSDTAHLTVTAKTLYGSPMSNMKFNYRVLANAYSEIENRALENIAENDYSYYGGGKDLVTGEGTFDKKGKAKIEFSTNLKDLEDSQIITVEISPQINASPSIATISKLVHRGTYAIFFKNIISNTEDGISGNAFTLNHETQRKPVADKELTVSLYKKRNDNTNEFISDQKLTTNAEGKTDFKFASVTEGSYELITKGTDERGNTITSKYSVYVGQPAIIKNGQSKTLKLIFNKKIMDAGDTSNNLTVTSDFDMGDLAITLNTVSESKDSEKTVHLRTMVVKQVNSKSFSMPFSVDPSVELPFNVQVFAVAGGEVVSARDEVAINTMKKNIATTVRFDKKETKPGETVQISIETKDADGNPISADNSLSLIDSAILQIGKIGDNIYNAFFNGNYSTYLTVFDSTTGIYKNHDGGGGGCFLTGTQIKTPNGSKSIEQMQVGDVILSRSSEINKELIEDRVTKTYRHIVNEYLTINDKLHVTPVHRIFLNNSWMTASEARVGDVLLDEYGNFIKIESIKRHTGQFAVYNLTTEKTHTFIAEGFYVHNEKGLGPRQNFADTAYWNPHIKTDSSGKATVNVKLPDNITTYTAQVYSNTNDSHFGQATNKIISKRDVVIIPVASNYYFTGDKPTISALIQNNSGKNIQGTLTLKIPEKNISTDQKLTVSDSDFESVKYKIDLEATQKEISIQLDYKDDSGTILDSVKIKKPILPKAAVAAHWESFTGDHNISFHPPYPQADFNTMNVSIVPHPANGMFDKYGFSNLSYGNRKYMDIDTGIRLYIYAYILSHTNSGEIPAYIYPYATLKNSLRDTVANALLIKNNSENIIYWSPTTYTNESSGAITLAMFKGLEELSQNHMLDEITNISDILKSAQEIGSQSKYFNTGSDLDTLMKIWVLGNKDQCEDAVCIAAKVLHGDTGLLSELKKQVVQSASDRMFWNSSFDRYTSLPALAMIEKGTPEDANKAIVGLAFQDQYGARDISLLAGIKHALKNKYVFEKPTLAVKVNNSTIYDSADSTDSTYFQSDFSTKNIPDGKLDINISVGEGLPMYGIAAGLEYTSDETKISAAKKVAKPIIRTLRSLPDGKEINSIPAEESGLVELKIPNDYSYLSNAMGQTKNFRIMDALSPQYMFLDQSSGNSPQYQAALKNLYGSSTNEYGYLGYQQYSDQFVSFNSSTNARDIILPYAVWNIADGTYYQPKTSLIYPILGVITSE